MSHQTAAPKSLKSYPSVSFLFCFVLPDLHKVVLSGHCNNK